MNSLVNILSTKTLSEELLTNVDNHLFNILSLDFIKTEPIPFDKNEILNSSTDWIISSKNTLYILFNTYKIEELSTINFYCVGSKTSKLITDNNLKLITTRPSSAELANEIVKNYNTTNFTFICGEMRRNELEGTLKNHKIRLNEFNIYSTTLSPSEILTPLDGILFFSPSAIKSYTSSNTISSETLFCIGNTTATEAKKYSKNIITAETQTFESVIESVKKHYT